MINLVQHRIDGMERRRIRLSGAHTKGRPVSEYQSTPLMEGLYSTQTISKDVYVLLLCTLFAS